VKRRVLRVAGLVGVLVVVIAVIMAATNGRLLPAGQAVGSNGAQPSAAAGVKTAQVERRTLQVTADLEGTLGYDGEQKVGADLAGTLTWLPAEGSVIGRGGRLYEVDGSHRAVLLFGSKPAWRTLGPGVSNGSDVLALEQNLKAMGYARNGMTVDRHWSSATTAAVKRFQRAHGLTADGVLDLGEVVFLPQSLRVTDLPAALGTRVGGGAPVLGGTTLRRVVAISLEADRQDLLAADAEVTVELPDGSTTPARVSDVGRVAHAGEDTGIPGQTSPATIDVTVSLDDPKAAGSLDQAPVTVHVVTAAHENVLAVPVKALVALLEGGYAVEVQAADSSRRYVGVEIGLFQDGWVEVSGAGLQVGDHVVVAS
jgi:peptidoglycan hydrolase-like protein with peptidoglycan-binding domain